MLVFPLGLGTRLRRWPLITLLFGVIWVIVFFIDRSEDRIVRQLFRAVAVSGVRDAARDVFVDYCKRKKGTPGDCRKYSILIWTGFPGQTDAPAKDAQWKDEDDDMLSIIADSRLIEEHRAAQKVRKELGKCGESRKCFTYKDILWTFMESTRADAAAISHLKLYGKYKRSLTDYKRRLGKICKVEHCLVSTNVNAASLAFSQVRHGGLLHLFSNLVMLIVFGVYVEQRSSRVLYFVALAIGGTIGMLMHAVFFSSGETMVLGGSANVSAAMGMFFVFFYHQKMTFRVWLPRRLYLGTDFRAPVKYCFPLVFILSDVIGGLDPGFAELSANKVAHFAHIFGFAVGAAAAALITLFRRLPQPFIYESEMRDMLSLEKSTDLRGTLELATSMARYNPENVHALEVGCGAYLRWAQVAKINENASLADRGRTFLIDHLSTVCAINAKKQELRYACKVLSQVPLFMPYRIILARLGQVSTLQLADYALKEGHPLLALRLYDFFLSKYPLSIKCDSIISTSASVISTLPALPQVRSVLEAFLHYHPESQLTGRIGAWLANDRAEEATA